MIDTKFAEAEVPEDAQEAMKLNKERWSQLKIKVN